MTKGFFIKSCNWSHCALQEVYLSSASALQQERGDLFTLAGELAGARSSFHASWAESTELPQQTPGNQMQGHFKLHICHGASLPTEDN